MTARKLTVELIHSVIGYRQEYGVLLGEKVQVSTKSKGTTTCSISFFNSETTIGR